MAPNAPGGSLWAPLTNRDGDAVRARPRSVAVRDSVFAFGRAGSVARASLCRRRIRCRSGSRFGGAQMSPAPGPPVGRRPRGAIGVLGPGCATNRAICT